MKATLTDNQRDLVNAVREELGDLVDGFTDEQLSLNMGRARSTDSAIGRITEWLDSLTSAEADQEDGQEDDQEAVQDDLQDSEAEGGQESGQEKSSKKKAKKTADPRLRNTYCGECAADLDITADDKGHWDLSCPNGHESAHRTNIPVTTAARMLLGLTWTQYKEVFGQDTSSKTARRVANAASEGMGQEEIVELLAS